MSEAATVQTFPVPNEHGVFEETDCEVFSSPTGQASILVVGQADGWRYSFSANLPDGGSGSLPSASQSAIAARSEAIIFACESLISWCSEQKDRGSKKHRKLAEKMQEWAFQLEKETEAKPNTVAAVIAELPVMDSQVDGPLVVTPITVPAELAKVNNLTNAYITHLADPRSALSSSCLIPHTELFESAWNPRQYYPGGPMDELIESMKSSGFRPWQPLLVRPRAEGGYEIAAGHRRRRAAEAAGIVEVPCRIENLSDDEFLDVLNFDNSAREDVHPLHEAAGWRTLMEKTGKSVLDIAARIGQSKEYVYYRLKFSDLIPAAAKAFLERRFTAGHAILIAREPSVRQRSALSFMNPDPVTDNIPSTRQLESWLHRTRPVEPSEPAPAAEVQAGEPPVERPAAPATASPQSRNPAPSLEDRRVEDPAQTERKVARELAVRGMILDAILVKVKGFNRPDIEAFVGIGLNHAGRYPDPAWLCTRHGLTATYTPDVKSMGVSAGSYALDVMTAALSGMSDREMAYFMVEHLAGTDFDPKWAGIEPKNLLALAKRYKVDAAKIRAQTEEVAKAAEGGKRKAVKKPKVAKAAKPKGAAKRPAAKKLSNKKRWDDPHKKQQQAKAAAKKPVKATAAAARQGENK